MVLCCVLGETWREKSIEVLADSGRSLQMVFSPPCSGDAFPAWSMDGSIKSLLSNNRKRLSVQEKKSVGRDRKYFDKITVLFLSLYYEENIKSSFWGDIYFM